MPRFVHSELVALVSAIGAALVYAIDPWRIRSNEYVSVAIFSMPRIMPKDGGYGEQLDQKKHNCFCEQRRDAGAGESLAQTLFGIHTSALSHKPLRTVTRIGRMHMEGSWFKTTD